MLPGELQPEYKSVLFPIPEDQEHWRIVKEADKLCAYLKCLEELKAGNKEFSRAERTIYRELEQMKVDHPEVSYFMEQFLPSFQLTLDELN